MGQIPLGPVALKVIVTGTGRCGTVYMSRVLTSLGLPCGHESIFDSAGWNAAFRRLAGGDMPTPSEVSRRDHRVPAPDHLQGDSSLFAAPFLDRPELRGVPIIHLVRNPVRVVNSFYNFVDYFRRPTPSNTWSYRNERFLYEHAPDLKRNLTSVERAALYWVVWNEMIEERSRSRPYLLFRVEGSVDPVLEFLGISSVGEVYDNREANSYSRPGRRFVLGDLPAGEVRDRFIETGRRYGYLMDLEHGLV